MFFMYVVIHSNIELSWTSHEFFCCWLSILFRYVVWCCMGQARVQEWTLDVTRKWTKMLISTIENKWKQHSAVNVNGYARLRFDVFLVFFSVSCSPCRKLMTAVGSYRNKINSQICFGACLVSPHHETNFHNSNAFAYNLCLTQMVSFFFFRFGANRLLVEAPHTLVLLLIHTFFSPFVDHSSHTHKQTIWERIAI